MNFSNFTMQHEEITPFVSLKFNRLVETVPNFNEYTHKELADIMGVSPDTIINWFNDAGIKKKRNSFTIDKNNRIEELLNKGLRISQIAKELNLTPRQVTVYRSSRGLKEGRTSKLELTEIEEQVVIGSLLGDGCIDINNRERGYYRLAIKHGIAQKDYIWYKYELLKRIAMSPKEVLKKDSREKFKNSLSISLVTTTNEIFKEYRERWYPNGKKQVNREDLFKLGNLGLAIWIMDDGSRTTDNSISISTDCFDKISLNLIQEMFLFNGIYTTVEKNGRLRFSRKTIDKIKFIILPHMPNSMIYKVRDKFGELLENLEIDNQKPSSFRNEEKVQRLDKVIFTSKVADEISTSAKQHRFDLC